MANFIRIGDQVINLEQINNVEFSDPFKLTIYFDQGCVVLRAQEAQQFWKVMQGSSLNITPKEPELPKLPR